MTYVKSVQLTRTYPCLAEPGKIIVEGRPSRPLDGVLPLVAAVAPNVISFNPAAGTLDQTYDLIFDLRPTILDDLGLAPAVRWYAESRLQPLGIDVYLDAKGLQQRLSPELETSCYRVIQEALLNIAKHAHARQVSIRLELQNGWLRGEVEDDGQGFDLDAVQRSGAGGRGMGLLGMQERIELLSGTFHIHTAPGEGTLIQLEVPIGNAPTKEHYQHAPDNPHPDRR